jgi:FkbM family methyltransferase
MVFSGVKAYTRQLLKWLRLDLTLNLKYDRLTEQVIARVLKPGDVAIDVGCHKGEILDILQKYAPGASHYAFEPLPVFYHALISNYGHNHHILPYALSDQSGTSQFHYVKNAPAYSGILKRKYDIQQPEVEAIQVDLRKMDEIIPPDTPVRLIKIDVEGAEMSVLHGGVQTINNWKPLIMFEFGIGASDIYGTEPDEMYHFFSKMNYGIYTLESWLKGSEFLTSEEFSQLYYGKKEFYYLANFRKK